VLASHQNCRALTPGERQFSDEQLQAIIARGAVIGVSMDTWMIYPKGNLNWAATHEVTRRERFPREAVTLADLVDHIDHICQLAGNANHVAIGTDMDGGLGREQIPEKIHPSADLSKLHAALQAHGWAEADSQKVLWENWMRFFKRALP
jgi:membrane dipeptidase